MFDVIVVGGGVAGSSAALSLGRTHHSTLVLDDGPGRNAPAREIHNFFGHDGTSPAGLRRRSAEQLARYPGVRLQAATAARAENHGADGFAVTLASGRVHRARRLLLATGLVDELPAIEGLEPLWGRSVVHCPYCFGYESTGAAIAVLGAGPERMRLALQLSAFSEDVVLCTNGPAELEQPYGAALEKAGVLIREEEVARLVADGDQLRGIEFREGPPLARTTMFVKGSQRQRSPLAAQLGCRILGDGSVAVDELARTSVAGVLAAGDMARRPDAAVAISSVVMSAAAGSLAAGVIDVDLLQEDFGLPDRWAGYRPWE
ncbi:NAD(P)/FAD-dependent oxidoreductase [Symbioplanes lichenis]|uniref:NAD(P)/FAD-dependent oxidoreductase n=1 Tax=Symbioplanes lichenis TaxID=1629072 RepID=UPI002738D357|nr:NAD(P)/FAD-dependent oxidoreductase [Actinoplanes lichenis]